MRHKIGRLGTVLVTLLMMVSTTLMIGAVTETAVSPKGSPWNASYLFSLPLVTQDGQAAIRFYEDLLKDKFVLINTIWTRCASCLPDAKKLAQVQQLLGERVGYDISSYSNTEHLPTHAGRASTSLL